MNFKSSQNTQSKDLFSSTSSWTKAFPSTREQSWDLQQKSLLERKERDRTIAKDFCISNTFQQVQTPHGWYSDIENLSPDPTFGGCGRQEHVRKMHCPHPQGILMHAVDTSTVTPASWRYCRRDGESKLTNPTNLGRNPLLLEATCTRTPQLSLSNWQARQMESISASPHRNETMGKILMLIVSTSAFSSLEIWKAFKARSAKCLLSTHSSPVK